PYRLLLSFPTRRSSDLFVDVDREIFELEPARTALLGIEAGLAQVGRDPRQQLPGPRRLDHVVIGPDLETHHDVDLLATAAHDHRSEEHTSELQSRENLV